MTTAEISHCIEIPDLPSKTVKEFIPYLAKHPDTPIATLIEPYKAFESELRKVYAQQPNHEAVKDGTINLVPIFNGHEQELKVRARDLDKETDDEKSKYIMSLKLEDRKANNTPAIVGSFKDFQQNFNLFSESALTDLDWNNVVAAGSAVTTALLPVPEKWAESKRSMREYYHEHLAPASDVDLFLYGLNEEQALEKIKQIEKNIKDSILHETTTIRTKNAITIASQYPTRHIQIVLRLYDSVSQIITGFDVDCACAAYDGKQVYAAPRAIAAFVTQCNTIDLTRRSPSYENRLSKYSHRGFEGLARLLILEKLPKSADRDSYVDQRRAERGRPEIQRGWRHRYKMGGNIKDQEEDEVAEWVEQEEVASYHTMTVPYGPKYSAAKINRLLYAKDLLLNAEWNQPDDREVYLHRHPCFFGTAEEVLEDCCGYCPVPKTDEEHEVAEEESKTYISGKLKFLMDDPGRQEIGSFNPITDDEWTTMAYVGDTARLCQAIVDGDLEHVEDWCSQEGVDVNRRDYTGRTPLHLATMASTPEIVQCLIDHGARMIARLVDGRTALHIAAARGNAKMVKMLMDRSLANEEEEEEKDEARRTAKRAERAAKKNGTNQMEEDDSDAKSEASEITLGSEEEDENDSMATGSFVKIEKAKESADEGVPEDSEEDPDVYEIDVIAWDYGLSPLHLAILNGHLDIVDLLVSEYGADVLLPVKLMEPEDRRARGAIMTIVLAMSLPTDKAKDMVKLLLELGATSAQADMNHFTALHYVVSQDHQDILDVLLSNDRPVALSVLNNVSSLQYPHQGDTPLSTSIENEHTDMVAKLLALGAKPTIEFDEWAKKYLANNQWAKSQGTDYTMTQYRGTVMQPIVSAAVKEMGKSIEDLLAHGADPCTLEKQAYNVVQNPQHGYNIAEAVLDIVQKKLKALREWNEPAQSIPTKPEKLRAKSSYTYGLTEDTYQYWSAAQDYETRKKSNDLDWKNFEEKSKAQKCDDGLEQKKTAVAKLIKELESAEKALIKAGGKTFAEMHPKIQKHPGHVSTPYQAPDPKPYKTTFNFRDPALNDIKKDGYKQLFEAAWSNDLDRIKAITLAPWTWMDSKVKEPPLRVAIQDQNGFSPFSIAVLRGHRELAKKIVEICATQYHKDDGVSTRQRWNMRTFADSDDESDNGEDLPIFSELVSDKFTVDNLGEVSNIVKSDILPLTMIEWNCEPYRILDPEHKDRDSQMQLLDSAIHTDDMGLLKFVIELGTEQQALLAQEEDDQKCYSVSRGAFWLAIRLGRTSMLAEMIKATGVGIPLNELIEKSGVEMKTKPRYYQGLSVGGKKRADWAQAPGGNHQVIEEKIPPMLQAAYAGSIDSVEWFMSDAPLRRYKEFAEANKHDKRIKTLEASGKGFDKTIGTWLNAKSELVLHCAILYDPNTPKDAPADISLIKHLVSAVPEALEQKSSEGWTPLQLAVIKQRVPIIEYLTSIGANQRHRDKMGRNMLHSMLLSTQIYAQYGFRRWGKTDRERLQKILALFDKEALKEMFLERCTDSPGALTPLAYWMANNGGYKGKKVIDILSKYSTGEDLEMVNGEGDLPLHVAIKNSLGTQTEFLLSLNPSLLYRENATGRTPLEMSCDIYIASQVENPPQVHKGNQWTRHYYPGQIDYNSVVQRQLSSFIPQKGKPEESKKRTWEICCEVDGRLKSEGVDRKRRLVSLFEANEVAKRVTAMRSRYGGHQMVVNGGLVDGEGKPDVFSEWM